MKRLTTIALLTTGLFGFTSEVAVKVTNAYPSTVTVIAIAEGIVYDSNGNPTNLYDHREVEIP